MARAVVALAIGFVSVSCQGRFTSFADLFSQRDRGLAAGMPCQFSSSINMDAWV